MTSPSISRSRRDDRTLRGIAAHGARRFPDGEADQVLAWAAAEFGPLIAVACAMADGVLPHVVSHHVPGVDVLFLDTGLHFPETLDTRDRVARELDVRVIDVRPALSPDDQVREHGPDLPARAPDLCCRIRKVEPLSAALTSYEAWVTGLRRQESPPRADAPVISWDEQFGLVKINPLATWSWDDLVGWAVEEQIPVNPLLDRGYPSIGCAPCTRPVAPGQDMRSGRWSGSSKTECGLHR
jgi:phosphoadenosine phosphosulfate reductase